MKFNTYLADATIGAIEANPESHNQGDWRCETGMCFAGWAAVVNGAKWVYENPLDAPTAHDQGLVYNENGSEEHVSTYARRHLGLDLYHSDLLFWGGNTLEKIKEVVKDIANEKKPRTPWIED